MARRRSAWLVRHLAAGLIAAVAFGLFWASRPQWSPDMRLWKAVGDSALVLLLLTMAIGPVGRLWRVAGRLLPFRRELGIWFAVVASVHTVLILNGWARWSVMQLLGYEFVPQLGRTARMEPGFGLANIIGLMALTWGLALAATSSDFALRRLGPAAWKWLHNGAYVIFWLTTAHVGYFMFLHYTLSFHKQPPAPDWFRMPFLLLAGSIVVLQVVAFVATVRKRRGKAGEPVPPPSKAKVLATSKPRSAASPKAKAPAPQRTTSSRGART